MSCVNVYGRCEVVKLSYAELDKATNGFAEVLGEGGFGKVYKATNLPSMGDVAVKRIHANIADGAKGNPVKQQFYNEVPTNTVSFQIPPSHLFYIVLKRYY